MEKKIHKFGKKKKFSTTKTYNLKKTSIQPKNPQYMNGNNKKKQKKMENLYNVTEKKQREKILKKI